MRSLSEPAGTQAERLRLLADAGRAFASEMVDYPRLVRTIVKTTAESLGGFCDLRLLSTDGRQLESVALFDFDPSTVDLFADLIGANPLTVDSAFPSTRVLRTGEPLLVAEVDASQIAARFRAEDRARAALLDPKSYLVSPLKSHGKVIGLLSLVRHGADARPLDEDDAAFAQSLADYAALAITNAHLLSDAKSMAQRLCVLSELAREFSEAADDNQALLALVARRASEVFGDLCAIRLVSSDGLFLESIGAVHHPDPEFLALAEAATAATRQRVGEGITGRVAATGEAVLIAVVDTARLLANLDPERRSAVERQGITSLVVVPLLSQGRTLGVMSLSRSDPKRPFNENDLRLLQDVAAHAALAIAKARSNRALHDSEEAHRLLFEASPLPLFVFDVETLAPFAVNAAALSLYGYTHDEFLELKVSDLTVDGRETAVASLAALGNTDAAGTTHYRRKNGTRFVAEYTTRALTFAEHRARLAVIKDITDRYEAEETRALLAAIVRSSNDAIISKLLDGTITSWNGAAERLFGYSSEEAIGKPITMLIPPGRLEEERTLIQRVAAGDAVDPLETVRLRKDGTEVVVSVSLAPILDKSGKVVGASKAARDLTGQHKAAEVLRRTEEQLRQAQKMEAVGRLAGGIAHDFNNLLSVILSYGEVIRDDLEPNHPARDDVDEIRKAALSAADLTRQLLMFSRQQVVEPKVLDLNEVLAGVDKILKRILGEDVDYVSVPAPHLGRVRADPSNVEQVIMNLAVNARDAMPTGGKLTIETHNVDLDAEYAQQHLGSTSGPHVMLAVTDTGTGMDQATQVRVFEPFFTTKGPGKGTGLGLSTVFGIAQQCGGSVWFYSELGKGTTFKVYFPRVEAALDVLAPCKPPVSFRGSETIVLVEDQEQVRTVAEGILKRNGYRTIVARNADEALLLVDEHSGAVHLLLTDIVMPNMSGAELAKRVAMTRPEMKVLYMSGYTDDSIVRHGVLESPMAFLQKPFTPESLTRRVREVLDAPRSKDAGPS